MSDSDKQNLAVDGFLPNNKMPHNVCFLHLPKHVFMWFAKRVFKYSAPAYISLDFRIARSDLPRLA